MATTRATARTWVKRVAVGIGVSCLVLAGVYGFACWWGVQIPINVQTTRVLGPVGADGRIDYAAAIDAAYSAGVTAENNAAVLMLVAVGSTRSSEVSMGELLKRMGAEGAEVGIRPLVTTKVWAEGRGVDDGELDELIEKAGRRPWSAEQAGGEFEEVKAFLAENGAALDLLVEAGKRERYWCPVVRVGGKRWIEVGTEPLSSLRAGVRLLSARAMMRVGSEPGLAVADAVAAIRLGGHLQRGSNLYSYLAGTGMKSVGHQTVEGMLGGLPLELVEKAGEAVAKDSGREALAGMLDVGERYHLLGGVLSIVPDKQATPVQWGSAMRIINVHLDELVAALKVQNWVERKALIQLMTAERVGARSFWEMMNGGVIAAIILPSLGRVAETADGVATEAELLGVAIEVERFKWKLGRYPETLEEAGVGDVKDQITGAAVVYRRDGEGFVVYSVGKNGKDEGGREGGDETVPRSQWPDDVAVRVE